MTKSIKILAVLLVLGAMSLQSCIQDECTSLYTYIKYTPVYKTIDDIRQDIQILPARELKQPGKIYFYQNYILLNEFREGLHVIDNADPANPVNLAFIQIPGNMDMAVKDNILYADNYIDLLSIDISNPEIPVLMTRTEEVFPSISLDQDLGHLVYYDQEEVTEELPCGSIGGGCSNCDSAGFSPTLSNSDANVSSGGGSSQFGSTGKGGSMARFALYQDFLYTVTENAINVFDIVNLTSPNLSGTVNIGWGIETIYPFRDNLFIGSQTGMFIYSVANPSNPTLLSVFEHAQACDPVVVKDDLAYITLRGGTPCQNFTNQLDVVDVSNLNNPQLLATYPMDNPHGLAITEQDVLYVCDGDSGLRVMDATDELNISEIDRMNEFSTYDVIALPNSVVMVIGSDGLYQFDASDVNDLRRLSVIPVAN